MKKLLILLAFISSIFAEENININFFDTKHLNSIIELRTFISSNQESTIGSNVISVYLKNKEDQKVSFKILKEIPLIITICDFKILKDKDFFEVKIDEKCNDILSKKAQKKHILETIRSIEKQIEFVYNKGDTDFRY
jgi:hypothetical protein